MNYLNKMYKATNKPTAPEKNPNRVSGGLRAQGQDSYSILGEDGYEKQVPTQRYVQSLEDQVRKLREAAEVTNRRITRQDANVQRLAAIVDQLKNKPRG